MKEALQKHCDNFLNIIATVFLICYFAYLIMVGTRFIDKDPEIISDLHSCTTMILVFFFGTGYNRLLSKNHQDSHNDRRK